MLLALQIENNQNAQGQELYVFLKHSISPMIISAMQQGLFRDKCITLEAGTWFSNQPVECVDISTEKGESGNEYKYNLIARVQMKNNKTLSMKLDPVTVHRFDYMGEFIDLRNEGMQPFSPVTLLDLEDGLNLGHVLGINKSLGKAYVSNQGVFPHKRFGVGIYYYEENLPPYMRIAKPYFNRPLIGVATSGVQAVYTKGLYVCEHCGARRSVTTNYLGIVKGHCSNCESLYPDDRGLTGKTLRNFIPVALADQLMHNIHESTEVIIERYDEVCGRYLKEVQSVAEA